MQKNNLPDNWREVRSDTKSKPRIDFSTPTGSVVEGFQFVNSDNQNTMDYEVYKKAFKQYASEISK